MSAPKPFHEIPADLLAQISGGRITNPSAKSDPAMTAMMQKLLQAVTNLGQQKAQSGQQMQQMMQQMMQGGGPAAGGGGGGGAHHGGGGGKKAAGTGGGGIPGGAG